MSASSKGNWFFALESLRGICAMMVALFHFRGNNHFSDMALIQNSWLFVDFFFVLSGFVIAASYQDRLKHGAVSFRQFLWLRFMRLYPLHLFVLIFFLLIEIAMWAMSDHLGSLYSSPPFADRRSLTLLLENLLLLQSLGVSGILSWNGPSWSISAELWIYALFAACTVAGVMGYRLFLVCAFATVLSIILWNNGHMGLEADGGVLRCLVGFAVGTFLWSCRKLAIDWYWGRFELPLIVLILVFVIYAQAWGMTIFSPLIFGLSVWVFSFDNGIVSKFLHVKILLLLGTLSYSIYMVHTFVWARVKNILLLSDATFDTSLFENQLAGPDKITGDLLVVLTLVLTGMVSWITYTYVERPCQAWGKQAAGPKKEPK